MASYKPDQPFPRLFSDEEIERRRTRLPDRGPPTFDPWPPLEAKFPRIAETVRDLWGRPELDRYLDRLLIDDRGNRHGFPPEVVEALLALSRQHSERFGLPPPVAEDWKIGPPR
ncbi:MAG: hypothetical protein ACREF4_05320 [Gammaproteobacteria bacterium]